MNNALKAIEQFYSIAINPELDYFAQLAPLAASGELVNKITTNQVLFKLCMIVDQQQKEIQALKDDRVAIAKKMIALENKPEVVDPSLPLG